MIIAIDFDGTIVEHNFPEIGREKLFAFETLRELQKQNHQLILWTYRSGKELEEAVEFCRERGVEFYAINKNYPEEVFEDGMSRKIRADIYIDDRNLGGFPGWSHAWQMLNPPAPGKKDEMQQISRMSRTKKGLLARIFRIFLFSILPVLITGCMINGCAGNREQASGRRPVQSRTAVPHVTSITSPGPDQAFTIGEEIGFSMEILSDTISVDSAGTYLDGGLKSVIYESPWGSNLITSSWNPGTHAIRIVFWYNGGGRDVHDINIILRSDIRPAGIPFRVLEKYPHDVNAYTQGLVYHNGFLYEGTGQYNESSLRQVTIETGEIMRVSSLPGDIWGEGITLFQGRIYQLSYRSQVGFVYEAETFRRLQKVYYQNKEGWGLTNDGQRLIMSDGSHRIYFMDPQYFTELGQIEVYDDIGPVTRLNELEYINGKVFANIYGQQIIVIIDPMTGKVTGKLDMSGILPAEERHSRIDVFNGIAWDPERELLYVTGKYWPLLFEVRIEGEF